MFKRIALAMTFIAAFMVAGLSFSNTAEAWRYYGPRVVARPYYNAYNSPGYYYGPIYR